MLDHERLRRAAVRSGVRHLQLWTQRRRDYIVCGHRLGLRHHRLWEIGPADGPPVGLVLAESLLTGAVHVTSEDPGAANRVLACEAIPFDQLPAVCFELLRTIGSGERHLLGLDRVARDGTTLEVRFAVESVQGGVAEWTCEFGPRASRRRIRPLLDRALSEAC